MEGEAAAYSILVTLAAAIIAGLEESSRKAVSLTHRDWKGRPGHSRAQGLRRREESQHVGPLALGIIRQRDPWARFIALLPNQELQDALAPELNELQRDPRGKINGVGVD
jgi:hypothetical protein